MYGDDVLSKGTGAAEAAEKKSFSSEELTAMWFSDISKPKNLADKIKSVYAVAKPEITLTRKERGVYVNAATGRPNPRYADGAGKVISAEKLAKGCVSGWTRGEMKLKGFPDLIIYTIEDFPNYEVTGIKIVGPTSIPKGTYLMYPDKFSTVSGTNVRQNHKRLPLISSSEGSKWVYGDFKSNDPLAIRGRTALKYEAENIRIHGGGSAKNSDGCIIVNMNDSSKTDQHTSVGIVATVCTVYDILKRYCYNGKTRTADAHPSLQYGKGDGEPDTFPAEQATYKYAAFNIVEDRDYIDWVTLKNDFGGKVLGYMKNEDFKEFIQNPSKRYTEYLKTKKEL